MEKILFDLTKTQPMNGTMFHGGAKYGIAVFKKLAEIAPEKIVAYYDASKYLDEGILKLCRLKNILMKEKQEGSIINISKEYGGVLYSPLMNSRYLIDSSIHIITTIHGLRVLELPYDENEVFYKRIPLNCVSVVRHLYKFLLKRKRLKEYTRELSYQRDALTRENVAFVTVSNHSKYSLQTFVPSINKKEVRVFYSPSTIDDSVLEPPTCSNEVGKYYLIVSGNRWVKNGVRAIIALDELFTDHPEVEGKVVVSGIKFKSEISVNIKNIDRFVFVGYVDEIKLKELYRNAYLLVYPSLNEGFGYPPLEAMHEGCAVVASATASIPEVCGDSVLYFNPYSVAEIKMRILQMEDESVRNYYIKKGYEREACVRRKQDEDLEKMARYILSFVKND